MAYPLKQSQTAQPLVFLMVLSSDHVTGATGKTVTVTLGKNGAAGAAAAGAVSEIDSTNLPGWYKVAGNATDTGTLGPLTLHATASGCDPTDELYYVVAYDPQAATNLGLTNLDAAVSTRSTYSGGAVASVTGNVGGNVVGSVGSVTGSVGSVTAAVTVGANNDKTGYQIDLSQNGLTPRALDAIGDTSLTVGDAFVCAIAAAAGKESVVSTAYTVKTPSSGTVIRTFTLDSATTPTSRS